jgi:ESF2/ABP1 family protein
MSSESEAEAIESGAEQEAPRKEERGGPATRGDDDDDDNNSHPDDDNAAATKPTPVRPRKVHKLSLEKTEDFNATLRRRGVVYVARVPPRLTPTKVKSLLSQFGEVTRVFLVEEDKTVRKRRRKMSGNGSKRYLEGWVEFASKRVAKHVAASLNTTPMSRTKRNVHYGDLWALKYLPKFKWSHLTEKVAYERRVREQKLRLETLQARKETAAYKQQVETGHKLDKIQERRRKRAAAADPSGAAAAPATAMAGENWPNKPRKTKQLRVLHDGGDRSASKAIIGSLL